MGIVTRTLGALAGVAAVSFFGLSGCSSSNSNNCSSTSGSASSGLLASTAGGCSSTPQQCTTQADAGACTLCLAQSCCDQTLACEEDSTCIDCLDGCSDQQSCAVCANVDSTATAFFACGNAKCSAQCGTSNACPAMAGDTACATCQKQSCCAEVVACSADTQCAALDEQLPTQCGMNLTCDSQAVQQSGNAAAANLLQCVQTSCATACGG